MDSDIPPIQYEQVVQVVRHSSSINNAFISTVDHLPCDIIRSIWFVQTCNLAIDELQQKLRSLGSQLGSQNNDVEAKQVIISQYLALKGALELNSSEARIESQALYNQVVNHKKQLAGELEQLQSVIQVLEHLTQARGELLKEQLVKHYQQNPLESQKEANTTTTVNSVDDKNKSKAPLKLILKLQRVNKLKKLKKNGKNRKNDKIGKILVKPPTKQVLKVPKKAKLQEVNVQKVQVPKFDIVGVEEVDNTPYCFCKQPSFGDMIGCDNEESCPNGDWFHYKCVGLLNRVDALKYVTGQQKWYCSEHCQKVMEEKLRRTSDVKLKGKKKGKKGKKGKKKGKQ